MEDYYNPSTQRTILLDDSPYNLNKNKIFNPITQKFNLTEQDIKKLKTEYGNMILFFIKKIQPNKPWDILYRLNQ